MIANNSKSYLSYLNKLADSYNSYTYHSSINKIPIPKIPISTWLKKMRQILKTLTLKLMIESELQSIRIFLVEVTLKIGHDKYLLLILFWKLIIGVVEVVLDLSNYATKKELEHATCIDTSILAAKGRFYSFKISTRIFTKNASDDDPAASRRITTCDNLLGAVTW